MPGPTPKERVKIQWSANFAYAMGLLASDGCLSKDGLLVDLTSKDQEQLLNFNKCIGVDLPLGRKNKSSRLESWRVQIKNRLFYDFLISIGFTPAKSKTIGVILIPEIYYFDFLRGSFDGDGCFYSYWDHRWKSSFMFYTEFASASEKHIAWIREENFKCLGIKGYVTGKKDVGVYQLKYAKKESLLLLNAMYKNAETSLSRKRLKIDQALAMIGKSLDEH